MHIHEISHYDCGRSSHVRLPQTFQTPAASRCLWRFLAKKAARVTPKWESYMSAWDNWWCITLRIGGSRASNKADLLGETEKREKRYQPNGLRRASCMDHQQLQYYLRAYLQSHMLS